MPQTMSDTVKVELPTWKSMDKPHKTWLKELQYRSKVGLIAHVAVQTRVDIMEHAVKAARRLNDPVQQ